MTNNVNSDEVFFKSLFDKMQESDLAYSNLCKSFLNGYDLERNDILRKAILAVRNLSDDRRDSLEVYIYNNGKEKDDETTD